MTPVKAAGTRLLPVANKEKPGFRPLLSNVPTENYSVCQGDRQLEMLLCTRMILCRNSLKQSISVFQALMLAVYTRTKSSDRTQIMSLGLRTWDINGGNWAKYSKSMAL